MTTDVKRTTCIATLVLSRRPVWELSAFVLPASKDTRPAS
jgi:hypothetical protein